MKAVWNGQTLAESDETILVEGNHYFPADSLRSEFFQPCERTTYCGWKGQASYYDLAVAGQTNPAAAWYYPNPKSEAEHIKGCVAFWNGVDVVE